MLLHELQELQRVLSLNLHSHFTEPLLEALQIQGISTHKQKKHFVNGKKNHNTDIAILPYHILKTWMTTRYCSSKEMWEKATTNIMRMLKNDNDIDIDGIN